MQREDCDDHDDDVAGAGDAAGSTQVGTPGAGATDGCVDGCCRWWSCWCCLCSATGAPGEGEAASGADGGAACPCAAGDDDDDYDDGDDDWARVLWRLDQDL